MEPSTRPTADRRPGPLLRTVLGQVLRDERGAQGRTLADVAAAARVSMPYLSEVERGRKEASSEVLAAVCGALGVELADVLTLASRDLAERRAADLRVVRIDALRARRDAQRAGTTATFGPAPRRAPTGPVLLAA